MPLEADGAVAEADALRAARRRARRVAVGVVPLLEALREVLEVHRRVDRDAAAAARVGGAGRGPVPVRLLHEPEAGHGPHEGLAVDVARAVGVPAHRHERVHGLQLRVLQGLHVPRLERLHDRREGVQPDVVPVPRAEREAHLEGRVMPNK